MSVNVEYVYCIVSARADLIDMPRGIDDSAVRAVAAGAVVALASSLDRRRYDSVRIAENIGDAEWLAPHAVAHDAIVTWASDHGDVVPLPMWVMFADEQGVLRMLDDRQREFVDTLSRVGGAREYCVRITADHASLAVAAEQMDPTLAQLSRQVTLAAPGEAYLLGRKLAEAKKVTTRNAAVRLAEQVHHSLSRESRSNVARATPAVTDRGVVLDGAYLVAHGNYDQFRSVLTELIATFEPTGVQFDFTGPWPPYNFVRES